MIAIVFAAWAAVVGLGGKYAYKHNSNPCIGTVCSEADMVAALSKPERAVINTEFWRGAPDTHWASNVKP